MCDHFTHEKCNVRTNTNADKFMWVMCIQINFIVYFNPFDTEPMAKIAVKMSIIRVVKFMSSPSNDFTSWQRRHQLLFGGQSGDLLLSLHWFPQLPPGGCYGLSMSENCSENSEYFDVWRTLAVTGVKGYRNRVICVSQVIRSQGPLMPSTPQMLPSKYCQRWPIKTWEMSIFGVWMRGHCPLWPLLIPI